MFVDHWRHVVKEKQACLLTVYNSSRNSYIHILKKIAHSSFEVRKILLCLLYSAAHVGLYTTKCPFFCVSCRATTASIKIIHKPVISELPDSKHALDFQKMVITLHVVLICSIDNCVILVTF